MNKLDKALDEFYIARIAYLLEIEDDAEKLIRFWETKRQQLRKHAN